MTERLVRSIASAAWLAILCAPTLPTPTVAETCPNLDVVGDREFWAQFPHMTENGYRDLMASYYGMKRDDWDEGWGWVKHNDVNGHRWEYPKLMATGTLLLYGFEDEYSIQGGWWINPWEWFVDPARNTHIPLRVISRHTNSLEVIYAERSGVLIRKEWAQEPFYADDPAWNGNFLRREAIHSLVATDKEDFLVGGDPTVLSLTESSLDILARGRSRELLHYHWEEGVGWTGQNPTTLTVRSQPIGPLHRYEISSDPVALSRDSLSLDVFATDDHSHLIHYHMEAGSWTGEDVSQLLDDDLRIASDPVVATRVGGVMDVVALSSAGQLLHYRWSPSDGWSSTNVSARLGTAARIEGDLFPVSPDGHSLIVYARSGYRLLLYAWTSVTGWVELDLTTGVHAVEGSPAGLKRGPNLADVFIRDVNGHLVHAYFAAGAGFGTEDVTALTSPGATISGDPVVLSPSSDRLDVFALSGHWIMHYYWSPGQGWTSERIQDGGFALNNARVTTKPVVALRGGKTFHVYSGMVREDMAGSIVLLPSRFAQFYAAIGPTVNSWHTNEEYHRWAAGSVQDHEYEPKIDDPNRVAWVEGDSSAFLNCPWFGYAAGFRASVLVHEAAHMNLWPAPHVSCSACAAGPCCDPWDFHGVRDPAGALNGSRNHTAYQVGIEYLADLVEFYRDDLPIALLNRAREIAELLLAERILDPPGWHIGEPRPVQ